MTEARLNPKAVVALFGWLTPRGKSLVAVGAGAIAAGLAIPEPGLVRVGALLVALPLVSALTLLRPRYLLSCSRRLDPPRVPAGQPATVTTRVENVCAAAHRRPAHAGRYLLRAWRRPAVRARRDRARRAPGDQLPSPCAHPWHVHRRPAAGSGRGRVRAGADRSPVGRPPARWWSRRGSSSCLRPPGGTVGSPRAISGSRRSRSAARTTRVHGLTGTGMGCTECTGSRRPGGAS